MPCPHFDPAQSTAHPQAPPLPQPRPIRLDQTTPPLNHAYFRPLNPRPFRPLPIPHPHKPRPLEATPPFLAPPPSYNALYQPLPARSPAFCFAPPLPAPPTAESRCCEAAPLQGRRPFAPDAVARRVRHPLKMGQWDPCVGRTRQWDRLVGGASWGLTQWELRVGGATWGVTQWGLCVCVGGAKWCHPMGSMRGKEPTNRIHVGAEQSRGITQ